LQIPGAQIFIYKRLLISSSSRNNFDDGTAAETANACPACAAVTKNCVTKRGRQLTAQNMAW